MDVHNIDDCFQENNILSKNRGQSEILTTVDLKIAFGVEKLLNLEVLVMETARLAADIEPLIRGDPQSVSAQALRMASEFDVLHAIVDSEVGELEKLAASIHMDIRSVVENSKTEKPDNRGEGKLQAATESFNQMQELIATIRRESATFDRVIQQPSQGTNSGVGYENGHMSPQATTQTEDQRNVLQMLQKSIASELDLGKELCDTMSVVEELKMNLYQAEQQSYFLEESVEAIYERMLSAENASQLFLGTSKDLLAKINTIGFSLSASVHREGGLKSKLKEGSSNDNMSSLEKIPADNGNDANQEAVQMKTPSFPEFLTLWDKIQQLEEWLRKSGSQLQWSSLPRGTDEGDQDTTRSEIITVRNIINELKFSISKAESRTQNAEARCAQLTQTNDQLYAELNSDRAGILEKRLKESDTQLEHAKASVEAVVEQQSMLKASMSDMEQMIEDLQEKFLKAETRAENAESKCKLLTDTNLELGEELSFLRGRVEGLENSLRQANQLKTFTAKDIGIKTKTISDLVAKLALERERLHQQIVTLTKKNKMLAQKCRENANGSTLLSKKVTDAVEGEHRTMDAVDEAVVDSSSTQRKVTPTVNILQDQEAEVIPPLEDNSGTKILETSCSMEPSQLNWKCILTTVLVLLAARLVYLLYKKDNSVQQLLRQFAGF